MTQLRKINFHKSFSMLEVLIAVAIFATITATVSIISKGKNDKLFLDECEKIRNFVCESIEIASSRRASFSIAVDTVLKGGYTAKAVIVRHINNGFEKYEYFYLKYTDISVEEKCIFDGVNFTMTPAFTWKIWKSSDRQSAKTLIVSGNGYCTMK